MTPRWLLPVLVALACDNSARNEQIANVDKKVETDDKRAEELKLKRLAEQKAKAEAEDRIHAQIVALAVAPEKPPKELGEACQAVADAQDRFMERLHTGEALDKWKASRERELPMSIVACTSADSTTVAGCQAAALDAAPPELKDRMQEILDVCVGKYAKPRAGAVQEASGAIPKRPR